MINSDKINIRNIIRLKRKMQAEPDIIIKSVKICEKLNKISEFIHSENILIYISKKEEVRTDLIIKHLLKLGKNIVVPYVDKEILKLSLIKNPEIELEKGALGVMIPKKEFIRPFQFRDIDLVIVPGIVFDITGKRIGFGKGYYDKLLKKINALKIALAFDFQVLDKIPFDKHDVNMDYIITEKRVVNCVN